MDSILTGFDDPEQGSNTDNLDDILTGFGEESTTSEKNSYNTQTPKPDWLELKGGISLGGSINYAHDAPTAGRTDHRGISRLKTAVDLQADVKLSSKWQARLAGKAFYDFSYPINGHDNYTDDVLALYEHEAEVDEMFIMGALADTLDIKVGRQVVTWGKSDNIRVTDILNPLDNREPGLVDIRDLRLPVTMTKLDYYWGKWNASAIVVHEMRFNKDPVYDNDFYPADFPAPPEDKPSTSLNNQEFGLAFNGIFSGWDLSLYGAYVYNDQPHFENSGVGFIRKHARIKMAGLAFNMAVGNWLLKGETALLDGIQFFNMPYQGFSRLDVLIGLEYSGLTETTISVELVNRHLFDYGDVLQQLPDNVAEDEFQSVVRISKDYWHDRLNLTLILSTFDLTGDDGAFQRLTCEYDWSDSLSITTGLITYQSGDKYMFQDIGDNDRIFFELRYAFSL